MQVQPQQPLPLLTLIAMMSKAAHTYIPPLPPTSVPEPNQPMKAPSCSQSQMYYLDLDTAAWLGVAKFPYYTQLCACVSVKLLIAISSHGMCFFLFL